MEVKELVGDSFKSALKEKYSQEGLLSTYLKPNRGWKNSYRDRKTPNLPGLATLKFQYKNVIYSEISRI